MGDSSFGHGYYKVPAKYSGLVEALGLTPPLPAFVNIALAARIMGYTRQGIHCMLRSGKLRGTRPEKAGSKMRRRVSMDSILANLCVRGEAGHAGVAEGDSAQA